MPIAKVNGINIAYDVNGQGEPLVLIMGFAAGKSLWMHQTGFFKKNYRVITFDNRGVGKSDKPEGPYSIRMMADDTVHLINHLGIDKAHILGASMGGMIAQELAINYPQKVMKLVLQSTFACQDNALNGETPEWTEAIGLLFQRKVNPMVSLMFNRRFNKVIFIPLMKIQAELMRSSERKGIFAQREAILRHHDVDRLPLITAPTLVIVGTEDRVIKTSSSEVMAKLIPNTKLVKVEGGSHTFGFEMSGRFNKEVLDFLTA
jgi:pimeloyl-ACP methyl ester carboxylesterase